MCVCVYEQMRGYECVCVFMFTCSHRSLNHLQGVSHFLSKKKKFAKNSREKLKKARWKPEALPERLSFYRYHYNYYYYYYYNKQSRLPIGFHSTEDSSIKWKRKASYLFATVRGSA